jgi:hypothetical protein
MIERLHKELPNAVNMLETLVQPSDLYANRVQELRKKTQSNV